jgi:hypothetical protein
MADFFGANAGSKSTSVSMNPVGNQVNPAVGAPVSGSSGTTLSSGVMQIGSANYGPGGATSGLGSGSGDPNAKGQRPEVVSQDPNYKWAPGHSA